VHEKLKDGGEGPCRDVDGASESAREDARNVFCKAPARDVRHAFEEAAPYGGEEGGDVDSCRYEEGLAECWCRRRGWPWAGRGVGEFGACGVKDLADEGEAVGVQAGGCEAEEDVPWLDGGLGKEEGALDGSDCKAREIVVACSIPIISYRVGKRR